MITSLKYARRYGTEQPTAGINATSGRVALDELRQRWAAAKAAATEPAHKPFGGHGLGMWKAEAPAPAPAENGPAGNGAAENAEPVSALPSMNPELLKYYNEVLASYDLPTVSSDELQSQIAAMLRPAYEQAIANRKEATNENRALIDVDAYSRGMGPSTWATDAKGRLEGKESADVANLESNYSAALAEALLKQLNENRAMSMNAKNNAYTMALKLYQLAEAQREREESSYSGGGGGGGGSFHGPSHTHYVSGSGSSSGGKSKSKSKSRSGGKEKTRGTKDEVMQTDPGNDYYTDMRETYGGDAQAAWGASLYRDKSSPEVLAHYTPENIREGEIKLLRDAQFGKSPIYNKVAENYYRRGTTGR